MLSEPYVIIIFVGKITGTYDYAPVLSLQFLIQYSSTVSATNLMPYLDALGVSNGVF